MAKDGRNIYLPQPLWEDLLQYAKSEGKSASAVIRDMLQPLLESQYTIRESKGGYFSRQSIEERKVAAILAKRHHAS